MNAYVFDVTELDFEDKVLMASMQVPVLVDFWAPWCAPCKQLGPILDKIALDGKGSVLVAKVNTDQQQSLASMFGIKSLPTVMVIHQGQPVNGFVGLQPESAIKQLIAPYLADSPVANELDEDEEHLTPAPSLTETIQVLRNKIANDPKPDDLKLDLAEALANNGELLEPQELLDALPPNLFESDKAKRLKHKLSFMHVAVNAAAIDELSQMVNNDPKNLKARYEYGSRLLLNGQHHEALEQFLSIMQQNRQYENDLGRHTLIRAFDLIDDADLVSHTRRRMAALLF